MAAIECNLCEFKEYCVARLNDPTVIGCGMMLYVHDVIKREEISVIHQITTGSVIDPPAEM